MDEIEHAIRDAEEEYEKLEDEASWYLTKTVRDL